MLPIVNLDNENYEEIFEKARKRIPGICPEWTDYNEHDPGITFLQLFSWMKEMQQFHLDQIGEENLKVYLKLLGIQQKPRIPAQTFVEIEEFEHSFSLPRGTRLMAGEIPFETLSDETIEAVKLLECVCIAEEEQKIIGGDILQFRRKMRCYPFGKEPKSGNCFLLKFDRALEAEKNHTIYFDIFDEYLIERNPIEKDFYPLAEIKVEYYGKQGFTECKEIKDNTNQLLHSGVLFYYLPESMEPMEDGTYGIRITLIRCEYDVAPAIQAISVNAIQVCQKATLVDYEEVSLPVQENGIYKWTANAEIFTKGILEVYQKTANGYVEISKEQLKVNKEGYQQQIQVQLETKQQKNQESTEISFRVVGYDYHNLYGKEYEMTGFPYQSIDLYDRELLKESFAIMIEKAEQSGVWEEWERVEDFHCSTPESRHYRLDEERGILFFGDCEHGFAPEGRMRIVRFVRSNGMRGNVRKDQIQKFENSQIKALVTNPQNVSGGRDKESIEACFQRFQREFQKVNRAVTEKDYETLVLHTPGLRIRRAKAVPVESMKRNDGSYMENCVSIVVQPFSYEKQAKLTEAYMINIMQMLEKKRLIGTKVQVLMPDYIGIVLFADIVVKPHYATAREILEESVNEYFEQKVTGFGAVLEENELYGLLDALECVTKIRNLVMYAQGRGVKRTISGNIQLPVNGLGYLEQADYMITTGET